MELTLKDIGRRNLIRGLESTYGDDLHLEFKKGMFSVIWNNSEEVELERKEEFGWWSSSSLMILIKAGKVAINLPYKEKETEGPAK